jgi:excisionase family DNA binding protein
VYLDHLARLSTPAAFEPRFGRSVSLDQAAGILRVSRRTVYNWIRAGRLQTIRTLGGNSQRVLLASLNVVVGEQPGQSRPFALQSSSSSSLELS